MEWLVVHVLVGKHPNAAAVSGSVSSKFWFTPRDPVCKYDNVVISIWALITVSFVTHLMQVGCGEVLWASGPDYVCAACGASIDKPSKQDTRIEIIPYQC